MHAEHSKTSDPAVGSTRLVRRFISICNGLLAAGQAICCNPPSCLGSDHSSRNMCNLPSAPPASDPQLVHPTFQTKAILWFFGRPWWGGSGWPNLWLLPLTPERKRLPHPIWLAAKIWLHIVPATRPRLPAYLQQAAILWIEIESHLLGLRGTDHRNPNLSHCSRARTSRCSAETETVHSASVQCDSNPDCLDDLLAWAPNVES